MFFDFHDVIHFCFLIFAGSKMCVLRHPYGGVLDHRSAPNIRDVTDSSVPVSTGWHLVSKRYIKGVYKCTF